MIDEGVAKKKSPPISMIWITPLRALAADTVESLKSALSGLGLSWSIELRTSDTSASVRKRAGFLNAHLWVTPYEPSERYAAGDYISQSPGGEGLVKWTKANRSVENTDIVVWYTLGVTHIPRPEEWPVMPVHRTGFKLMPAGFFARNPALDVPRATK